MNDTETDVQSAPALRRRDVEWLKALGEFAHAVTATPDLTEALRVLADGARHIIGAHRAVASIAGAPGRGTDVNALSLSERYAESCPDTAMRQVAESRVATGRPMRLTRVELKAQPEWSSELNGLGGILAPPLIGQEGRRLGLICLSDKVQDAEFDQADEAMLVQLAEFAATAIERAYAVWEERHTLARDVECRRPHRRGRA